MAHKSWPPCPVIYQVYPRSFLDTTGTGVGDLNGITKKIDYIASLNVDAIWISPFYLSPLDDGGYDVADHSAIDPAMGTDADFDALVTAAHDAGLKVVVDQVLNHTSDQHHWFRKSIDKDPTYDDFYVWKDPKPDGTAPNNWLSFFSGPAWTWNHRREQYYLHQFLSCQPNLNLRNPAVQDAHRKQMQYWRNRGVDGFRMDAVSAYLHDDSFADNPVASADVQAKISGAEFNPYSYQDHTYDLLPGDGAAYSEKIREWAGDDAYIIGEINSGNQSIALANAFTEAGRLNAAYTIDLAERGMTPEVIVDVLDKMAGSGRFGFWLSSHDQARHVTNLGDASARDAKFLALANATLPGPLMIYQGEELGLPQPELKHNEVTDPYDLTFWPDGAGREGARVPMPWDKDAPRFGFSSEDPWLRMRWDGAIHSVAAQESDENAVLHFYRDLLQARRANNWADTKVMRHSTNDSMLRLTLSGDAEFLVILSFGHDSKSLADIPASGPIIATDPDIGDAMPGRSGAIWRLTDQ